MGGFLLCLRSMITTIIFDFAGVVTKEGFRKGLIRQLHRKYQFDDQSFNQRFLTFEDPYMAGQTDSHFFWEKVCRDVGISYDDFADAFIHCYEFNLAMVEVIRTLKRKCRVIMLTDNFDILSQAMKQDPLVQELFDKVFYSNEIGMIKKNPKSFEWLLREQKLKPDECLFIDDKEHNLAPAKSIGMNTIHFTDMDSFKEKLSEMYE